MTTGVLVAAAMAAAAGVVVGDGWPDAATALTAVAIVGLAGSVALRFAHVAGVVLLVATVGFSSAANTAWRATAVEARLLASLVDQPAIVGCGTVIDERPRSLELSVRSVETNHSRWRVREPALVVGDPVAGIRPGARVCVEGRLRPPRPGIPNPPLIVVERVEPNGIGSPLRWWASAVRERFHAAATAALPDRQAGVLLGMTQGDRSLLDEVTVEAFRTTGLAHLVAVSGFHVAVVLGLLLFAAKALVRRSRWVRVVIAVPPLVFFAFLTGLGPSVLRAVVTAGIVLIITASGRVSEGLRVAAAAFILLVFASPDLVHQPGFQMSFGATTGLILWAQRLSDRLLDMWTRPGLAAQILCGGLGTATAAQLGVAPFLAAHFGAIPVTGALANLIVIPLAPIVVGGGLATLTLASLWSGLEWAPALLRLPIDAILATAVAFASLPAASVSVNLLAGGALTACGAALLAPSARVRAGVLVIAVLCAGGAFGQAAGAPDIACSDAEIRALDVGQGTAVLIRAGEHAILADGGKHEARVVRQLHAIGVRHLDMVVPSHPHADHTEGIVDALERMPVGAVIAPWTIGWGSGADVVRAARDADVGVHVAWAGESFQVGPRIRVDVLAPEPGPVPDVSAELINSYNLVVAVEIDGVRVMLPGDANGLAQAALVGSGLESAVLVAPHHGSADVEPLFVEEVSARVTLVTVGPNPYGHPREEALSLYAEQGRVLRTDLDGGIALCLDGDALQVITSRQRDADQEGVRVAAYSTTQSTLP